MNYSCCDDFRRSSVKAHPTLNGIDFLEVSDNPADPLDERETTLFVHFLKPIVPGSLDGTNVVINGGERIQNIAVLSVTVSYPASPLSPPSPPDGADTANVLVVKVSEAGDFTSYTLQLIAGPGSLGPPPGYDPVLSSVVFSFKVLCPSDFDCQTDCGCLPEAQQAPPINYMAKDFSSFRQLMLDRMAALAPDWQERHTADLGIALVELLAYTADYLSYRQDAISTEAYLGTARKRVSVRRHVRLVDYFLSDGCNSRVWAQVQVIPGVSGVVLKKGNPSDGGSFTRLLTGVSGLTGGAAFSLDSPAYQAALDGGAVVFEPMEDTPLYSDHNELSFYTWGNQQCCLPKGSTAATLLGCYPHLQVGQILLLQEVLGPETGVPEDADPSHRQAVCLTSVSSSFDPLYPAPNPAPYPVCPTAAGPGIPVTEIQWGPDDALGFPLCISSRNGNAYYDNVSVALGNILLADYGLTSVDTGQSSVSPDTVPAPNPVLTPVTNSCDSCSPTPPLTVAPRYYPMLLQAPLTQAASFVAGGSAVSLMSWTTADALPVITLTEQAAPGEETAVTWEPLGDLLGSAAGDRNFVVEIETDGTAYLRFGDGILGKRPAPGARFLAAYRTGNGKSGNIGAGSLAYIFSGDPAILSAVAGPGAIQNPLPATGGLEPETIAHARQNAPDAFRTQERAVIADDYETLARQTDSSIQRAACTYRWTGSWRTAYVSIDRLGAAPVDTAYENTLRQGLEPYRMAGQNLEINGPEYVSLFIKMEVCVNPDFFASDVEEALLGIFSNKTLPDGTLGVFHPDNFTFGQTVYLSPFYAAAQNTTGVDSVQVTRFHRQGDRVPPLSPDNQLQLGQLEIGRLDNDPNYPEHGLFKLVMNGGK